LAATQGLASALSCAQAGLLADDLHTFERQTACQREFCAELRSLHAELARAEDPFCNSSAQQQALLEAHQEACRQARLYAALLRRARRTVDIFCRVLASSGTTYVVPRARS